MSAILVGDESHYRRPYDGDFTTPSSWMMTRWRSRSRSPPVPLQRRRGEHAGEHCADDTAEAMHAEHVERVIHAEHVLEAGSPHRHTTPEIRPITMAPIPQLPQAG